MAMPEDLTSESSQNSLRFREIARVLTDRVRLARWGEDRPGVTDAHPPAQPRMGPGGTAYHHASIRSGVHGQGELAYWIFEPADPIPASASLIIFLHGWGGADPASFGAWIDHLVKRGNLVLFPVYQDALRTSSSRMLTNAVTATKEAIVRQQQSGSVRPNAERVAIVGHSLGGTLAAQMAAVAEREGLPVPKAIMPIAPGRGEFRGGLLPWVDLQTIPSTALMLVVVGEDDQNVSDRLGRAIYVGTSQIPSKNKNFIVMRSDYHGTPPLVANHRSAGAANPAYRVPLESNRFPPSFQRLFPRDLPPVDAMDYYGYWKLLDGLTDAAFSGRNRVYALGDTPQQRFMGMWSDGTPVKEPRVITDPRMLW